MKILCWVTANFIVSVFNTDGNAVKFFGLGTPPCVRVSVRLKALHFPDRTRSTSLESRQSRQKRPTTEEKETYYRGKRDLLQRQKRPTTEAKETYYRGKRDLLYR